MIVISYLFTLAGGGVISHEVKLDSLTGASPPAAQEDFPAWVDLHFHQCANLSRHGGECLGVLDMFAKGVPYTIGQALHRFDGLFSAYFPRSPQL